MDTIRFHIFLDMEGQWIKYSWIVVCLCFYSISVGQSLKINEVLSSNTIHEDEDGENSDWLEIYNASAQPIDLENWSLSDDLDDPLKWQLPAFSLPAYDYLHIWASGKDRRALSFSQSIIKQGDVFNYLIPDALHDKDWYQAGYDDTAWEKSMSGFGYGDGDDATVLPQGTGSLFIRRKFHIEDSDDIINLILDVDYDDAFVAYINGVEVARANISGRPPSYNDRAPIEREATLYSSGKIDRFLISNPRSVLRNGENVLAVQTHNVSSTSSDLSIIPFLSAELSTPYKEWDLVPSVIDLPNNLWHTNFKLSGGKESLYLFDPEGVLVDSLYLVDLPPNVSIGCVPSDQSIKYFDKSTPGTANVTKAYQDILETEISFSNEGGQVEPLLLELDVNDSGGEIRYTLDAELPTESSLRYDGPISIDESTIIRANYFKDGYLSPSPESRAYLLDTKHDLPIVSLITEPDNLYDFYTGIYVRGSSSESDFPFFGSNFWKDWEKPVHFSFYDEDGALGEETNAGIKIFGGWSRAFDQRSFSLFARQEYGDGAFKYPFFPELNYSTFESLVLRNSGNDWNRTMLRDATLTSLMTGADLEFQAYRPIVVYVNGRYFGLYNMREKINEHFAASKKGLDAESIDVLELDAQVLSGSNVEYLDLIDYVARQNLSTTTAYAYLSERIDIDNFALYFAAQIYFDNTDWPGNNIKYWKSEGGKWRWVLFDTDFGFGIWDSNNFRNNTLQFALRANGPNWPNPPWSTLLFRQLNTNRTFQHVFINQMADAMNSRFKSEAVNAKIERHKTIISKEMPRHFERWNGNHSEWIGHIQNMKRFASLRSAVIKEQIKEAYTLPSVNRLNLSLESDTGGYVVINNRLQIEDASWSGDYFGTIPITLTAVAKPGFVFSHWQGDVSSSETTIQVDVNRLMTIKAIFQQVSTVLFPVIINEINYKSNKDFDTDDWIELYNSSDVSIDLSNWVIADADGNRFSFPLPTLIEADSYLILAQSVVQFEELYPTVNVIGNLGFGLSSGGDELSLFNHAGELQDQVSYSNTEPWPEDANGVGYTLELISPELDNAVAQNWDTVNQMGSPGRANAISTAVINVHEKGSVHVYPIPTTEDLTIDLILNQSSQILLQLISLNGQVETLLRGTRLTEGTHQFVVDMSLYPVGIYKVSLRIDGEIFTASCLKLGS